MEEKKTGDILDKRIKLTLDLSLPYLTNQELVKLKLVSRPIKSWTMTCAPLLLSIRNIRIENESVISCWETCLHIEESGIDINSLYERLRGYGFGEQFLKSEGVYGDIARDVNRTFPNHVLFHSTGGIGQLMLENILRCVSEYFPNIGYCQGMNFVVGSILIGIIDPSCEGFRENDESNESDERIVQYAMTESQSGIEKRTFHVVVSIIRTLHMEGLWSAGIPELKIYIYLLQHYMKDYTPELLRYFDDIGYDVSIIVSKWFITLFAYTLPFPLLFRLWGYIFQDKWIAVLRVSVALLLFFQDELMKKDIVEISMMMKYVRTAYLQKEEEIDALFRSIVTLDKEINEESYQEIVMEYEREKMGRMQLTSNYLPSLDKKVIIERQSQITKDITSIRKRLEVLSEREYAIKKEFKKYSGIYALLEEEEAEMRDHKKGMLNQVESLMYLDQNMLYDPDVNPDETTKISFLRQQDISVICAKISSLTEKLKQKKILLDMTQCKIDEVNQTWQDLLREKNLLKDDLLVAVKQQTNLYK